MLSRTDIATAVTSVAFWLLLGTVSFWYLEEWTWIQAFYFSVVTLATVGYGDLTPTSDISRLFTAFFILMGVGIVVAALSVIGTALLERRERRRRRRH